MSFSPSTDESRASASSAEGHPERLAAASLPRCSPAQPHPADPVADWFEPLLAQRLVQADMPTLGALARRIDAAGARWWYPVRGMGVLRASRVVQWLREHPGALGLSQAPARPAVAHASRASKETESGARADRGSLSVSSASSQSHD